jgi:hypothetical protein
MVVTFYVHSDPRMTAKCLDKRRLGKQRVEAKQIIDALTKGSGGWINHPATKMWEGYTDALKDYFNIMCQEFIYRGGNQGMELYLLEKRPVYPPWTECHRVHYSHQARLVQKEPGHYFPIFQAVLPPEHLKYGYIWPHKHSLEALYRATLESIAEPYKEDKICMAIKRDGKPCVSKASYGNFCGTHKPKDYVDKICRGIKANGLSCAFKAKEGDFCGVHKGQSAAHLT